MSLLWADEVSVFLSAHGLEIRHQQALTRKRLLDKKIPLKATQGVQWAEAIAELKRFLQTMKLRKQSTLKIYLGADLVRFLCIPAQSVAMSREEENIYVNAMFQKVYMQDTSAWKIHWDTGAPDQTTVAYAIDRALFERIEEIAQFFKLKLAVIAPYAAAVFNRCIKGVKHSSYLYCCFEPHRIVLMDVQNHDVHKIKTHKIEPEEDVNIAFSQLLERESVLMEGEKNLLVVNKTIQAPNASMLVGWKLMQPDPTLQQDADLLLNLL